MRGHVNWQPILEGSLRKQTLDVVSHIAEEVKVSADANDGSLAHGSAGIALLYGYLALFNSSRKQRRTSLGLIDTSTNTLEETTMSPSLYSGFTGIAWACKHLEHKLSAFSGDWDDVDRLLKDYLGRSPWRREYDLISGLVGLGVYALCNKMKSECLKRVIDRLEEVAEENSEGVTWFTLPELLPESQRVECPNGYYNLGLAHGIPGVISFLAQTYAAKIQRQKVKRLLQGAVGWILRQKLPNINGSFFSSFTGKEFKPIPARSAWCYGDPGIAAALFAAARSLGNKDWERQAMEVALHAATRPVEEAGVKDSGLCHGSSGLAHIFNRLFQASGNPRFKETAKFWILKTLEMRQPGKGVGGYLAYWPNLNGKIEWKKDPGFLTGAAGIALALLAASTNVEPQWDQVLLLNIPLRNSNQ